MVILFGCLVNPDLDNATANLFMAYGTRDFQHSIRTGATTLRFVSAVRANCLRSRDTHSLPDRPVLFFIFRMPRSCHVELFNLMRQKCNSRSNGPKKSQCRVVGPMLGHLSPLSPSTFDSSSHRDPFWPNAILTS